MSGQDEWDDELGTAIPPEGADAHDADARADAVDLDGETAFGQVLLPMMGDDDVADSMADEELPRDASGEVTPAVVVDDTPRDGLLATIEALTFVSNEPMTVSKVREMYQLEGEDVPVPEVKRAFRELLELWSEPTRRAGRGLTLVESGSGIRFRTEAMTGNVVRRMFAERPQRLSRAALETLAIIAYRQPLTRPQVDEIRGVDSSGALKALMDRRLVRVLGKADDVGRPLLYGTTRVFLEFFGLSSLRDLPTLKQVQELDDSSIGPLLQNEARAAVVMDLFDPKRDRLVSEDTDAESREALEALEAALGRASAMGKRAGTEPGADDPVPEEDEGDGPVSVAPARGTPARGEEDDTGSEGGQRGVLSAGSTEDVEAADQGAVEESDSVGRDDADDADDAADAADAADAGDAEDAADAA
ncbi:MAG: SMC-Scp complex subunit ScpB, partial [Myxococcota bacterium]